MKGRVWEKGAGAGKGSAFLRLGICYCLSTVFRLSFFWLAATVH